MYLLIGASSCYEVYIHVYMLAMIAIVVYIHVYMYIITFHATDIFQNKQKFVY